MKRLILATVALFGLTVAPSFAADSCLGSETITEFKSMKDGSVVVTRESGGQFRLTLNERPGNMEITNRIKTRSEGDCLAKGDNVVMTGLGGHRKKYTIASVESLSGTPTAAATPTE